MLFLDEESVAKPMHATQDGAQPLAANGWYGLMEYWHPWEHFYTFDIQWAMVTNSTFMICHTESYNIRRSPGSCAVCASESAAHSPSPPPSRQTGRRPRSWHTASRRTTRCPLSAPTAQHNLQFVKQLQAAKPWRCFPCFLSDQRVVSQVFGCHANPTIYFQGGQCRIHELLENALAMMASSTHAAHRQPGSTSTPHKTAAAF